MGIISVQKEYMLCRTAKYAKRNFDLAMDHWNAIILKDFTHEERANIINTLQLLRQKAVDIDLGEALRTFRQRRAIKEPAKLDTVQE